VIIASKSIFKSFNRGEKNNLTKADYFLPIPASEKNKDPNLTDNNGAEF